MPPYRKVYRVWFQDGSSILVGGRSFKLARMEALCRTNWASKVSRVECLDTKKVEGGKMLALSIKQPWAWLICKGYKDIENRDWPTTVRGRFHVHASLTADRCPPHWILDLLPVPRIYWERSDTRGAIIGEVDIVDCVTASKSPWFVGKYGFILANPVLYDNPVPCKGKPGFFEVKIVQKGGEHAQEHQGQATGV